jgi:uncharacterized membrane protein YgcG
MKRRDFLSGLVAGATLAAPALAQDYVASIIDQLKNQGFRSVVQERTLLGRVRIIAARKDGRREIIVNPRTGEILRDLWTPASGAAGTVQIIEDKPGKSGSGSDDDEDDDEDNDEDNDEDDSENDDSEDDDSEGGGDDGEGNSGSGSGGSGGGSGGSGGDDGEDDED